MHAALHPSNFDWTSHFGKLTTSGAKLMWSIYSLPFAQWLLFMTTRNKSQLLLVHIDVPYVSSPFILITVLTVLICAPNISFGHKVPLVIAFSTL